MKNINTFLNRLTPILYQLLFNRVGIKEYCLRLDNPSCSKLCLFIRRFQNVFILIKNLNEYEKFPTNIHLHANYNTVESNNP